MRKGFAIFLIATIIFGGTYWYNIARAVCDVPITYRIGTIDPRFNISVAQAKNAVSSAESLWENRTGMNLFTYDDTGLVTINFVYDDRQQQANDAAQLREVLAKKENMSSSVSIEYNTLLTQYNVLKAQYKTRSTAYDTKLSAYNTEVARWNSSGGAPQNVYAQLSETQVTLKSEQATLNTIAVSLKTLARQMNALGAQGNTLVTDYNKTVQRYNMSYTEGHEFTQGDYGHSMINIYEYITHDELILVLAHEMGHALSLQHVGDPKAIMYHLMGQQLLTAGVTQADLSEFSRVCGDGSVQNKMVALFRENILAKIY